ncbi:hypothetical protein [Tolypothrix sp. VBCCA 56010]|uniref:hypothetical protein n=1 Tax=Tolypothrix sp. VBCCA 56010 TaxID=3137731 RepID=UPI003D7E742A
MTTTWNDMCNATTKKEFVEAITTEAWDFAEVCNRFDGSSKPITVDGLINDICRTVGCKPKEFNDLRQRHGFSDAEMLQVATTDWRKIATQHNISWDEEYGEEIERLAERDE